MDDRNPVKESRLVLWGHLGEAVIVSDSTSQEIRLPGFSLSQC